MANLDQEFLNTQKERLLQEKARIEDEMNQVAEPDPDHPGEFRPKFVNIGEEQEDNANEVAAYELNMEREAELEETLEKVNKSLEAIEAGNYGTCEGGDEIEVQRLKALPWATTCIKHAR